MASKTIIEPPLSVKSAFQCEGATFAPLVSGHLNATFRVQITDRPDDQRDWILQRVNDLFDPLSNETLERITGLVKEAGLATPELIRPANGELFVRDNDGALWRGLTLVPGHTILAVEYLGQCESAGRLVGQFHRALAEFNQPLPGKARLVHDIDVHRATLDAALATHGHHVAMAEVQAVAGQLIDLFNQQGPAPEFEKRMAHGDLKISNFIFDDHNRAVAVIDLDTLSYMAWPTELGDGFRSWCATTDEDDPAIAFDCARFEAAVRGYSSALPSVWSHEEWMAIGRWVAQIAIELGMRFAADALNESYFGYDRQRFEQPWQHHLLRAQCQLRLAKDVTRQMADIDRLLGSSFIPS